MEKKLNLYQTLVLEENEINGNENENEPYFCKIL